VCVLQFGLDLSISKDLGPANPMSHHHPMAAPVIRGPDTQPYGQGGFGGNPNARQMGGGGRGLGMGMPMGMDGGPRRPSHSSPGPNDLVFTIPRSCVGAVIGKGGQHLKDLQAVHGVRVYIEKEDIEGKRTVVLSHFGGENSTNDPESLVRCQQNIDTMVTEQLNKLEQKHVSVGGEGYGTEPHDM
jgi:hypothetical protein